MEDPGPALARPSWKGLEQAQLLAGLRRRLRGGCRTGRRPAVAVPPGHAAAPRRGPHNALHPLALVVLLVRAAPESLTVEADEVGSLSLEPVQVMAPHWAAQVQR